MPPRPGRLAEVLAAAALGRTLELAAPGAGPWGIPDAWRLGGPAGTAWRLAGHEITVRGPRAAEVSVDGGDPVPATASLAGGVLALRYGGRLLRYAWARDGETCWLGRDGQAWAVPPTPPGRGAGSGPDGALGTVRSPMPGTVAAVRAAVGEEVRPGQPLVVVEAMKMEHTVVAPVAGRVAELAARAGAQVGLDEILAVIAADGQG